MHDPENSLFEAKNGFWPEKCRLGAQKNGKKWAFGDYLQNLPSKKVVTHLPTFLMVIESPLHWPFVRDIFFPLILVLERCAMLLVIFCFQWVLADLDAESAHPDKYKCETEIIICIKHQNFPFWFYLLYESVIHKSSDIGYLQNGIQR